MPPEFPFISETPKGLFLNIRLQPRASKEAIDGIQGCSLKIRLTAPPVEGEANKALVEFLSSLIGVRKSALSIDSGHKSRDKRVKVDGVTRASLEAAFSRHLS